MAGIYVHIPFCRKACHYCNFHFSTTHNLIPEVTEAICREAAMRKAYIQEPVETIYFGGGTPSLLSEEQLKKIPDSLRSNFQVMSDAEVTLESNPDDISMSSLNIWKEAGINRLSIGVQSFFEDDLRIMNRAHNAQQAEKSILLAQAAGLNNITIDLIYGIQGLTDENWKSNIQKAIDLQIPHLSCYALTVEEGTALANFIAKGKMLDTDPEQQSRQFHILTQELKAAGYRHYEISNFAKPGFESKHNSSYWKSKPYIGLGPSAHSYNGASRQWNIANNALYVQSIAAGTIPAETEILTNDQKLNEKIMISLRMDEGLSLKEISTSFSQQTANALQLNAEKFLQRNWMNLTNDTLTLTEEGKFFADGIAAELFV